MLQGDVRVRVAHVRLGRLRVFRSGAERVEEVLRNDWKFTADVTLPLVLVCTQRPASTQPVSIRDSGSFRAVPESPCAMTGISNRLDRSVASVPR